MVVAVVDGVVVLAVGARGCVCCGVGGCGCSGGFLDLRISLSTSVSYGTPLASPDPVDEIAVEFAFLAASRLLPDSVVAPAVANQRQ